MEYKCCFLFYFLSSFLSKHTCLMTKHWGSVRLNLPGVRVACFYDTSVDLIWIFSFVLYRLLLTRDGGVEWRLLQSSSRMNHLPEDMERALTGSQSSHASLRDVHSINPAQLMARIESYEGRERKGISDVRRTFCLFVTFDLLFVTLLWIIELNVSCFVRNNFLFREI